MQPTLPEPLLSHLSDLLATQMGLHFPQERWGDLERGIKAAAPALGMPDTETCARRLLSIPLTRNQIETLASHLTVGETYFLREKRSLEILEQHILPELRRLRTHAERRLRIWSAGCCTGEEPYSIAMLLDRLIPEWADWNITLLATDINPEFLRKAATGVYGEWSFRDTPQWVRDQYFKCTKNGRFEIQPHIRAQVIFSYLNLADDTYPSLANNTNAMDVILCRNVLMYFTPARARAVVENLYRSLVGGGWLIVSPSEISSTLFSAFTTVEFDGAILYRKPAGVEAPRFVSHVPAAAADTGPQARRPEAPAHPPLEPSPEAPALPATAEPRDTEAPVHAAHDLPSRAARDCANQGRLGEAVAWCEQAIAADKLNPAYQYLLATIQQEQGLNDAAVQSLARALYLDPDFVLAHFALGNLRLSQGRRGAAQRHFANALTLLRAHPQDEILPESEGLTAGRLGEIIASVLLSLPQAHDTRKWISNIDKERSG
jgi:chemotaxis protein methyltransferase CheR